MIQPMLIIGVGTTGQKVVKRLREYLHSLLQDLLYDDLIKSRLLKFVTLITSAEDAEVVDEKSFYQQVVISEGGRDVHSLQEIKRDLNNNPLFWLDAIGAAEVGNLLANESGAGGIRYRGRLSLWRNYAQLEALFPDRLADGPAIAHDLDQVTLLLRNHAKQTRNLPEDQIAVRDDLKAYIIGSLGGGTCSGAYIDLAYFIRGKVGIDDVTGIFSVPHPDWTAVPESVFGNFFCSLKDLEYYSSPSHAYVEVLPWEFTATQVEEYQLRPYHTLYLVNRDKDTEDPNGIDLNDKIACKLLFDFFGMSSTIGDISVDKKGKRGFAGDLRLFDLGGVCYPRHDLLQCGAAKLALLAIDNVLYSQTITFQAGKKLLPANFEKNGRDWMQQTADAMITGFKRLDQEAGVSYEDHFKALADRLPEKVNQKAVEDTLREELEIAERAFFEAAADQVDRVLGPAFEAECKRLFEVHRNLRAIESFIAGAQSQLGTIDQKWRKFARQSQEGARKAIRKSAKSLADPTKVADIKAVLDMELITPLILKSLTESYRDLGVLKRFDADYIEKMKTSQLRSELLPDLKAEIQNVYLDSINTLLKTSRSIRKVDRLGKPFQGDDATKTRAIEEEIGRYFGDRNLDQQIVKSDFWDQWTQHDAQTFTVAEIARALLEEAYQTLTSQSVEPKLRLAELAGDEKRITAGQQKVFGSTAPDFVTPGHGHRQGVPKLLVARNVSKQEAINKTKINFGTQETRNSAYPYPFLDDFMVIYNEWVDFDLANLNFFANAEKKFKAIRAEEKNKCMTMPVLDPAKMAKMEKDVRAYKEELLRKHQLSGVTDQEFLQWFRCYLEDFLLAWDGARVRGLSPAVGETVKAVLVRKDIARSSYFLLLERSRGTPPTDLEVHPNYTLAAEVKIESFLMTSLLERLQPAFSRFEGAKKSQLNDYWITTVKPQLERRGMDHVEINERHKYYFSADRNIFTVFKYKYDHRKP